MPDLAPQSFDLEVENPSTMARSRFPVTLGVPFPRGALRSADRVELRDDTGQSSPLQTRQLVPWPDGSIKWLLLDFQADLLPQQTRRYKILFGDDVNRSPIPKGITVDEDAETIRVDNGRLRFALSKERFRVFESLALDGNHIIQPSNPSDLLVLDAQGERYYASLDGDLKVEVEERGSLRSVIKMSGKHVSRSGRELLDFVFRVHVYSYSSFVKLEHAFINKEELEEGVQVDDISLQLSLNLGQDSQRLLRHHTIGYNPGIGLVRVREAVDIRIGNDTNPYIQNLASVGEDVAAYPLELRTLRRPGNVDPWLDVSDSSVGVTTQIVRAQENHPKQLVSDGNRLEYHLWPPFAGTLSLPQGRAKTHEIFLNFHLSDIDDGEREQRLRLWELPAHAITPFAWYQKCQVYGLESVPAYQPKKLPKVELFLHGVFLRDTTIGIYPLRGFPVGMFDYGDVISPHYTAIYSFLSFGPKGQVWMNNEYDFIYAALIQYLRTGRYRNFRMAENAAWHTMDVDHIHYSSNPLRMGGNVHHCVGHTTGTIVPSHMWTEGLLGYYYLTGRPQAMEVAKEIGENILRWINQRMDMIAYTSRESGWPLMALCELYNATLDSRYLEGAGKLVEFIRQVTEEGKGAFYPDNATFGVAVALLGVKRYHQVTQETSVKELFLTITNWWLENRYTPEGLPCYSWGLHDRQPVDPSEYLLFLEALAYAYQLTGDEKYINVGMREWEYHMAFNGRSPAVIWQHSDAMCYRTVINFVKCADDLGKLKPLEFIY